jgi:serine/threonine protein kinase
MPDPSRQSGRGIEETVVVRRFGQGALPPGTVLAHTYVIEQLLNRGSLGDAYRARHIELGTLHTVTIVPPRIANDTRAFKALVEQVRRLEQVHDEAVVAHQGLSHDDNNVHYLVTEYIEGKSLGDFLRQRKLEPDEVLRLRGRLAHGLAAVHERGVMHGDLSPDAILLPDHDIDKAKLVGFGTATLATLGDATVVGKKLPSTYAFASPEQTGLFGGGTDTRSDIYSLGLVLAAAALGFGKRLDMGTTLTAAIAARRSLPDISSLPDGLRPAIAAMLQPFPENRRLLGGTAAGSAAGGGPRAAGVRPVLASRPLLATAIGLVAAMLVIATISGVVLRLVSPAPTLDELSARVAAVTRHFKCDAVDQEVSTDGTVRLSGHLASREDIKKLRDAVAGIADVERVTADLRVMAWPHCELAAIVSPLIRPPGRDAPSLSLKGGAPHAGNSLILDVRAPNFDGYLYLDLFDNDGEVQHLFPTMRDLFNLKPAYNHFVLGCPPLSPVALPGRPGERTISLLATSTPLFPDTLLASERAPAYFVNLTAALARLQVGEAAAALIGFNLRAPADGENSRVACAPG